MDVEFGGGESFSNHKQHTAMVSGNSLGIRSMGRTEWRKWPRNQGSKKGRSLERTSKDVGTLFGHDDEVFFRFLMQTGDLVLQKMKRGRKRR